jgi:hypothetical protein
MTWKRFKDIVESKGVTDDQEIWYIDVSFPTETNLSVHPERVDVPDDLGLTVTT